MDTIPCPHSAVDFGQVSPLYSQLCVYHMRQKFRMLKLVNTVGIWGMKDQTLLLVKITLTVGTK